MLKVERFYVFRVKFEDLRDYQKVFDLALSIHSITLSFPRYEMFELGSQMRRASNSIPANIAEGFGNKHTNIYLESFSRVKGELREIRHHLKIAYRKGYIEEGRMTDILNEYEHASRMLFCLEKALLNKPKS